MIALEARQWVIGGVFATLTGIACYGVPRLVGWCCPQDDDDTWRGDDE